MTPQPAQDGAVIDAIAAALTNSCVQAIARGLRKAGRRGGLGDSRALRAGISAIMAETLRDMDDRDIEKTGSSMGTRCGQPRFPSNQIRPPSMLLDDTNWSVPSTEVIEETTALLIRARSFLVRGWCRGAHARDAADDEVMPTSERAVAWCMFGALVAAGWDIRHTRHPAYHRLSAATNDEGAAFNDRQTTVEPVLAAFDRAIAAGSSRDLGEAVDPRIPPPDEGLMQRFRETLMSEE
jgi:hypothetical protein